MKKISLVSERETISGGFKGANIIFLVWDGARHDFNPRPSADKYCIAAFCKDGDSMVAVSLHNSFSSSTGGAQVSWLKNGDTVHVGLNSYKLNFSVKKRGWKIALCVGVLIAAIVGLLFFPRPPANRVMEKKEDNAENLQRDYRLAKLMFDAKGYIKAGDASQARLNLEEIFKLDPENKEAAKIYGEIDLKAAGGVSGAPTADIDEINERGDIMLKQGREALDTGDYKKAYGLYKDALALVGNGMPRPAWIVMAEEGWLRSKKGMEESVAPSLARSEVLMRSNDRSDLKLSAQTVRAVIADYPESMRGKELLSEIYKRLDAAGMEHVMKGETLQRLSGCREAVLEYRAAMEAAAYPDVPAYQRAEAGVAQCQ